MRTNSSTATEPTTENSKPTKARRRPRRFSIEPNEADGPQLYKSDLDAMTPAQRKAHMRPILGRFKQICAEMVRQVAAARDARAAHRAAAAGRQVERRGGGRPAAKRARSGQDSDDDSSGEAEPPSAGRPYKPCLCGCGEDVSHRRGGADYLNGTHRQRGMRARDKANPDRVAERDAARLHAGGGVWTLLCDCKPKRDTLEPDFCWQCGHPRESTAVAWLADFAPSAHAFVSTHGLKKRGPRHGDRKRKPVVHKQRLPSGEVVPL